ncbi:MAG: hypothetical protein NVS3B9_6490 [Candidatus Doudnabacteria bacterium]
MNFKEFSAFVEMAERGAIIIITTESDPEGDAFHTLAVQKLSAIYRKVSEREVKIRPGRLHKRSCTSIILPLKSWESN